MRVWSRIALIVVFVVSAPLLTADHFQGNCPLSLVDSTPTNAELETSPHGVFRSGNSVFVLRANILTTYTVTDLGDLTIAREDFIGSLGARESEGGVAFSAGFLFLSSEAGLEIYDLRNVRAGGNAPILVVRRAGLHYRRLVVSGNRLAGLYPGPDLPCYPTGVLGSPCFNTIDIFNITTINNPTLIGSIDSRRNFIRGGFNDISFNFGFIVATSDFLTLAYNISNPASPIVVMNITTGGKWLVSNNNEYLSVGNDQTIHTYRIDPVFIPFFTLTKLVGIPQYVALGRGNPIRFSRHAWYDDANARLITLIDEVDQMTQKAARTVAFDVFDYTVPQFDGAAERIYEDVTMTTEDEVKYNPLAVGAFVYVVGRESGLQSWGSCGFITGRIELESPSHLTCNGAEIHGWVTGVQKVVNVELFLGNTTQGAATIGGPPRTNVSSSTPVFNWRINVNLDNTARGEYILRAIGTDILGNRRQFASERVFFNGPGQNCTTPRRRSVR